MKIIRDIDRGGFGYFEEVEVLSGQRLARKTFDPQILTLDRVSVTKKI